MVAPQGVLQQAALLLHLVHLHRLELRHLQGVELDGGMRVTVQSL